MHTTSGVQTHKTRPQFSVNISAPGWLRLLAVSAFLLLFASNPAAAKIAPEDLNDLTPHAGPVDAKLNALGMHIADYRVDADAAAERLIVFMRDNPDHEITAMFQSRLAYSGYVGMDRKEVLGDAIAEARKNLYISPGMSTVYASNRIFNEVATALQNSSYKLIGLAGIAVLVALTVMTGMIRGGLKNLSRRKRRPVPANTDTPARQRRHAS